MQKKFHNVLLGISVLPVLMIMPAMGVTTDMVSVTEDDQDLSLLIPDGVVNTEAAKGIFSDQGKTGSLLLENISVTSAARGVYADGLAGENAAQSIINLGDENTKTVSVTSERALQVWDRGVINIVSDSVELLANLGAAGAQIGILSSDDGLVNLHANNLQINSLSVGVKSQRAGVIDLNASQDMNIGSDAGTGVVSLGEGSEVSLNAKNLSIDAYGNGLYARDSGKINVNVEDKLTLNTTVGDAITAWTGTDSQGRYVADSGGVIDITTGDLTINAAGMGVTANYSKSQIAIEATGDVNITSTGGTDTRAVHAGNSTTEASLDKEDTSFVTIKAKNINLTADKIGISTMSNAYVELDGNTTINAKDAILTRGWSNVIVNKSGKNTVKMDGNINFDYDGSTSGTTVDSTVDVVLNGADSYWNGNTVISYGYYIAYNKDENGQPIVGEDGQLSIKKSTAPSVDKLVSNSASVTLQNGAVWNATKITDTGTVRCDVQKLSGVDYPADLYDGEYYTALNNLTINNGTVNILDMERGLAIDNLSVADATFNGGVLNVKDTLNVTAGTSVFNTDVAGNGTLTIANGATMDVGTQNIAIKKIVLNGTMNAKLNDTNDFVKFNVADSFDGAGTLNLSLYNTGEYKIFDAATFDNRKININVSSVLFDYVWNDDLDTLSVSMKSVEEIAEDNGLSGEAAATVTNLVNSSSEKLNALADAIQDSLAAGDTGAVEHAHAAINPETESVVQSVAASIQNTVANLTAGRLAAVSMGRSGGDVDITGVGVWAQGIYNKSKQNGAFNGYTRSVAGGVDMTLNRAWMLGAGYSYAHSDIAGTARNTDVDSSTIFVYGQYKPTAWFVNAMANYTMSDYSERGSALGAGVVADYDVRAWGGHVMTGYDFAGGITPAIGLRYMHVSADDYKNSLGIKNSLKDSDYLTAVLDTRWNYDAKVGKDWILSPELHYAVKYDLVSDENTATVLMPGVNSYVMDGTRLSRIGAGFGAGLGVKYRGVDLTLNYDIELREGYTSQTGRVKARYEF